MRIGKMGAEVMKMNTNTILVCDDDKEIVDAIEIYLSQEGYQILKAYDGLQAVNMMEKHEIQLLIIDIMMPKLDGLRATLKIHSRRAVFPLSSCLPNPRTRTKSWASTSERTIT